MARLNRRPSDQPSSRHPSSRCATETPVSDGDSDDENNDPTTAAAKGKGRDMGPPSQSRSRSQMPTPSSDQSEGRPRGQKRKRVQTQAEDVEVDLETEKTDKFNRFFDPNQDPEERREVKRKSRLLEREFNENRRDLLENTGTALRDTIDKANDIFRTVKQTNDATLDSRLLVNVSDVAQQKTRRLALGDSSTGVDVDDFLAKCLAFMRNGGPPNANSEDASSSSRRPVRRNHDDSDDEDDETMVANLDWEAFGRNACFPSIRRPPVPSFLLGPLSVEKKHRTQTQRKARQSKDTSREKAPETLSRQDLQQSDENSLTAICKRIRKDLEDHSDKAQAALETAGITSAEQLNSAPAKRLLHKYHLTASGATLLFNFVINPHSFGQSVENLFYISFLIKEGVFGIDFDEDGMPALLPVETETLEEKRKNQTSKHQAVLGLDYPTWRNLVKAFDIRESMIPHRTEETATQVGQRGWYS